MEKVRWGVRQRIEREDKGEKKGEEQKERGRLEEGWKESGR